MININKNIYLTLAENEKIYLGEVQKKINGEFTLQKFSFGVSIANRTSVINHLIKKNNLKKYLEIGVRDLRNFEQINIEYKIGVDPKPLKKESNIIVDTSDNFFIKNNEFFDIIFIDGLHLEYQVDNDLNNSFNCLSPNGYIIMHDCNPPSEFHQREKCIVNGNPNKPWNGTTWRSYAKQRIHNSSVYMSCVNCDWGVGVIKKGFQKNFNYKGELTYKVLNDNRSNLLNLISVQKFLEKY